MNATTHARSWDKPETQELMAALGHAQQFWTLAPMMRAVTARLLHAQYHFTESRRIIAEHIDQRLEQGEDIYLISFPMLDDEVLRHHLFFVQCEAHMLACAQAIHATADILAHVVYYALGLNLGERSLDEWKVRLESVIATLSKGSDPTSDLVKLVALLNRLKVSSSFAAVNELVNQAKHRGGPGATLAIQPSIDKPYEMRFGDFFRNGHHPAKGIDELLSPAFQIINETVVDVGIELNAVLRRSLEAAK